MKFFVPGASNEMEAERIWNATVAFAKHTSGWDIVDRKIFQISYVHEGKSYLDEVGKPNQRNKEVVCAILESNAYLVCTGNRGVLSGEPILVGKSPMVSVKDFE